MKRLLWSALLWPLLAVVPATAKEFVLSDAETASRTDEWSASSTDLGIPAEPPFSVKKSILHGGKQEGVESVEVDNDRMTISVIPTRGMNVLRVRSGDITLGWNSPVKQIVNPAFIELDSRGGLGWLDGFNEMLVRCGFEWAGHPGMDNGKLLTLHGRAGNIPAAKASSPSTISRRTGSAFAAGSTSRPSSSSTIKCGRRSRPSRAARASGSATR
jgi:uncharacterized protein DUF4432